jgi:AcrR family transcriptional regulator
MSDMKTEIMDAAERRMQAGGFGGFSFREIAADVGIKSSSVHYHFPTKEDLAAAVIRRWAGRSLDKARPLFEAEVRRRPRGRYTIRQRSRVLDHCARE